MEKRVTFNFSEKEADSWNATYRGIIPYEYLDQQTYEKREKLWQRNIREGSVFVAENQEGGNCRVFDVGRREK